MYDDFETALKFVLKWEGFISEDVNDKGGLTLWGISSRSHKDVVLEMKRLIEQGDKKKACNIAKEIYYQDYWLKCGCDNLPYPFNLIVFNCSINCGRRRAMEFLDVYNDWRDYLLRQIEFYASLKGAKYYLRGWINRICDLYKLINKDIKDGRNR